MPPVPVYISSPINAAKPSGVTPQTEAPKSNPDPTLASRYVPQPTPTQQPPSDGPPPPQPGAVPHLPKPTATASTLPPSPKAGETYIPPAAAPPEPTAAPQYPPPPQMSMPAPASGYRPQGTATSTAPRQTLPGFIAGPQGYQQNNSSYRAGFHGNESEPARVEDEGVLGSAMKWAQAAGKKLSEAESEVWRRINGDGK